MKKLKTLMISWLTINRCFKFDGRLEDLSEKMSTLSENKWKKGFFYFLKPKMGTYKFWVKNVNHEVWNDKVEISIDLRGGTANQYREQLINKAVFEGVISEFDLPNMYDFEIDKILKSNYSKI